MNRRQKVVVAVGGLVIAGLALFPPWCTRYEDTSQTTGMEEFAGLRWFGARHLMLGAKETWDHRATSDDPLLTAGVPGDEVVVLVRIWWPMLLVLQVSTLALTIAAVLVLMEGKAPDAGMVTR